MSGFFNMLSVSPYADGKTWIFNFPDSAMELPPSSGKTSASLIIWSGFSSQMGRFQKTQ